MAIRGENFLCYYSGKWVCMQHYPKFHLTYFLQWDKVNDNELSSRELFIAFNYLYRGTDWRRRDDKKNLHLFLFWSNNLRKWLLWSLMEWNVWRSLLPQTLFFIFHVFLVFMKACIMKWKRVKYFCTWLECRSDCMNFFHFSHTVNNFHNWTNKC